MCLNAISLYRGTRRVKRGCASSIYVALLYKIEKNVDKTNESKTHDNDKLYEINQKNRKIFEKIRKQLKIHILQFAQIVIITILNAKNHFLYSVFEFDFIIVDETICFF